MDICLSAKARARFPSALHRTAQFLLFANACLLVQLASAASVVDPLSVGATDVSFGSSSPYVPVTNPVPDPFDSPPNNGLLVVGRTSFGALEIDGGSQANIRQIWIGLEAGSSGQLSVSGAGSALSTVYGIDVGLQGVGAFDISNGATVSAESVAVRSKTAGSPSHLSMNGIGTKLDVDYGLFIGDGENSIVSTSDNALLEAVVVNVGWYASDNAPAMATVTNHGKWVVSGELEVGTTGRGSLTISDAGEVDAKSVFLGGANSGDPIPLTLSNGTLRVDDLYASAGSMVGTGTVFTKGLVADLAINFDATHDLIQVVPLAGQPGVAVELDHSQPAALGAGYRGNGSLTIADGRQVVSSTGYLGYDFGGIGQAFVQGAGSKWETEGDLYVGRDGAGELRPCPEISVTSLVLIE